MKKICLLFFISLNSFGMSPEKELFLIMNKNFNDKEISNNKSLCMEYNSLFEKIQMEEKKDLLKKDCEFRQSSNVDAESITKNYFDKLNNQINTINNVKNKMNEYETKIVVETVSY
jgi:hypothetical protein